MAEYVKRTEGYSKRLELEVFFTFSYVGRFSYNRCFIGLY